VKTLQGDIKDWWYDVADWLFPKQMDKAYEQGIRVGAEYAARLMSFQVIEAGEKAELTKSQQVGFEVARKAIRESKKTITSRTGAML
jgi:hypothetical protein